MTEPMDILRVLRGRWRIIAACLLVAVLGALFIFQSGGNRAPRTFDAEAVVVPAGGDRGGRGASVTVLAVQATSAEVASRAAATLDFKGAPAELRRLVTVETDAKGGTVTLHVTDSTPKRAADVANAFADGLVTELAARRQADYKTELDELRGQLTPLQQQIAALDRAIQRAGPTGGTSHRLERDSKQRQYTLLANRYQQLVSTGPGTAGVEVAQRASEVASSVDPRGSKGPQKRVVAGVIALMLGLIIGFGTALVVEHVDPRIRSRASTEANFGLPVLAELPIMPRRPLTDGPLVAASPRSKVAASFRLLRTGLAAAIGRDSGDADGAVERGPRTILVIAPEKGSGTTTIVANLASIIAETGVDVMAVCADFRRPLLHKVFGSQDSPGLVQLINGEVDRSALQSTEVQNVSVVASGGTFPNPGKALSSDRMGVTLQTIHSWGDVVVIDTAPLLDAGDASPLLRFADSVVVVGRTGLTTVESARRTGEFLGRLGVPTAGVVLVGPRRMSIWQAASIRASRTRARRSSTAHPGTAAPPTRASRRPGGSGSRRAFRVKRSPKATSIGNGTGHAAGDASPRHEARRETAAHAAVEPDVLDPVGTRPAPNSAAAEGPVLAGEGHRSPVSTAPEAASEATVPDVPGPVGSREADEAAPWAHGNGQAGNGRAQDGSGATKVSVADTIASSREEPALASSAHNVLVTEVDIERPPISKDGDTVIDVRESSTSGPSDTEAPISSETGDRRPDEGPLDDVVRVVLEARPERGLRVKDEFLWKHEANPSGVSPILLEMNHGRTAGVLPFMRWELGVGVGETIAALRADDVFVHPDSDRVTLTHSLLSRASEMLGSEAQLLFAVPRSSEVAIYVQAGWRMIGHVPVYGRSYLPAKLLSQAGIRNIAPAGERAADAIEGFCSTHDVEDGSGRITSRRSVEFLQWRYGASPHGYRAFRSRDAMAIYRVRPSGRGVEVSVVELFASGSDAALDVLRGVRQTTAAQQVSVHVDRESPSWHALKREHLTRAVRRMAVVVIGNPDISPDPTSLASWRLTIGDIERI